MNQQAIEKIIHHFYQIPVICEKDRYGCMVSLELIVCRKTGKVKQAIPNKIVYTENIESYNIHLNFLPENLKKVATQYNVKLVSLLHEIGHVKTYKGLVYKRQQELKVKAQNNNFFNCQTLYRNIPCERRADKWAIDFIIKHPDLCKEWSNELDLNEK